MTTFVRLQTRLLDKLDLKPCDGCKACELRCTSDIPITLDEFLNLASFISDPVRRDRINTVLQQDKEIDLGDGVKVTACRFQDMESGYCSVYPVRPLICRLLGHVEWMPCPINRIKVAVPTEDALELMRAYANEKRRSMDEWFDGIEDHPATWRKDE